MQCLSEHVDFKVLSQIQPPRPKTDPPIRYCCVDNLVKFVEPTELRQLLQYVRMETKKFDPTSSATSDETGDLYNSRYQDYLLVCIEYKQTNTCVAVETVLEKSSLPSHSVAKLKRLHRKQNKSRLDLYTIANILRANSGLHNHLDLIITETDKTQMLSDTQNLQDLMSFHLSTFQCNQVFTKDDILIRSTCQALDVHGCPYLVETGIHTPEAQLRLALDVLVRGSSCGYIYNTSTRQRSKIVAEIQLLSAALGIKFDARKPRMSDDAFRSQCAKPAII